MTELVVMDKGVGDDEENCWLCCEPVNTVFNSGVQIFNCPHRICRECADTFNYRFAPTSRCGVCRQQEKVPADNLFNHPFVRDYCMEIRDERNLLVEKIKELEAQLKALKTPSENTTGVVDNERTRFNLEKNQRKTIYDKNPLFLGDNQGREISGEVRMFVERNDGDMVIMRRLLNQQHGENREMPRVIATNQNREYREKFIELGEWAEGFDEPLNPPYPGWEEEKFKMVVKGDTKQFVMIKCSHTIKVMRGNYGDVVEHQDSRTKTIMEKGVWYRKRILRTPQGLEFLQMDNTWRFLNIPAFYFRFNITNQQRLAPFPVVA